MIVLLPSVSQEGELFSGQLNSVQLSCPKVSCPNAYYSRPDL